MPRPRKPPATPVEKLGRRGIVAFEIDGILARLTKSQSLDLEKHTRSIDAVAAATALMQRVRQRLRDERRTADGAMPGYGKKPVALSEQYQRLAGLPRRWFNSSEQMHAALPNRTGYSVTGAMWAGLQVRGTGRNDAIADFAGRSVGRGHSKIIPRNRRKPILMNEPQIVRNSQKAGAILYFHRVNILEPTMSEAQAVGFAVADHYGSAVTFVLSSDSVPLSGGDARTFEAVRSALWSR